jgi:alpha/beta superfamily hydrolase
MKQIRMILLLMVTATTLGQVQSTTAAATALVLSPPASGGSAPADIVYARPGQLVDVGGFRLNFYCMGSGSPTVVFDSGWGDWTPAWS